MAKLNEVLKNIMIKAGYKADAPEIKEILEAENISNIEVNDEIATGINGKLISLEAAKNHPDIGQVYRAQTLDAVDKKLSNVLDLLEVDDADKTAFLSEHNTYKRLDNLNELIKKAKKSKAGADTHADKAEHQAAIEALNEEVRKLKAERQADQEQFQTTRKNDLKNFTLKSKIKNFKTILDGTNETAKFATCNTVINSLLDEHKAELVPNENGELVLQTKTGDPVYNSDTNEKISADDFLELALSKNKLLVVSNAGSDKTDNEGRITPPIDGHNKAAKLDGTQKAVADFNRKAMELLK